MLQDIKEVYVAKLAATDGDIGPSVWPKYSKAAANFFPPGAAAAA